jgi:uncharacterized protein
MKTDTALKAQPVIANLKDFNPHSGSWLERILFNHRGVVAVTCLIVTLFLGFEVRNLRVNAGFDKMIPLDQPYIKNYLAYGRELKGLGNNIRIVVEANKGTILNPQYLATLQKINDEVFLLPGVDRPAMKSLWTPNMTWTAVTEEGFSAGHVIDEWYDGSPKALAQVAQNIDRSGQIGQIVANDFRSSAIYVPLLEKDAETGKPLDYKVLYDKLEAIRQKYDKDGVKIRITGFAEIVGNLIAGLKWFILFFIAAILIDAGLRLWYIRDLRSMSLLVGCSLVAVLWLLGLLPLLGYALDPYAVLVPFLIFSIGMSHGSQKMNGILQDVGRGTHKLIAARYTFRRLFTAGLTALLADAVGFAVLTLIKIQAIHDLAIVASIGVAILIFTNLMLLPILLSYTGVGQKAAVRSLEEERRSEAVLRDARTGATRKVGGIWGFCLMHAERKWATIAVIGAILITVGGLIERENLKVGDLAPGAPEFRPNSRYNRDNKYTVDHYGVSSDVLVIFAKTPGEYNGTNYENLLRMDALEQQLKLLPGVQTTNSMADFSRWGTIGMNEGDLKWGELIRNQSILNAITGVAPHELFNPARNVLGVYVYLKDHKAETLTRVVDKVEAFAKANNSPQEQFLLGGGMAGIEAATNIVVKKATDEMLYWIFGAVALLCFIAFRSWRAVLVAIIPLATTTVVCEAVMAKMGIGVKVDTLPVIALGVGIGVDYALYVLSVTLARLREGMCLRDAYYSTLCFTGRIVLLTGLTLAFGVATWVFAPIKFQADMGLLLLFMFIWNMLGALLLLPALAYFFFPEAIKDEAGNMVAVQVVPPQIS